MSREQGEGHRKRVRERWQAEGLEHFTDHEVLELLLFHARPRVDTKQMAKQLLDSCGSLKAVLDAPVEQLRSIAGIGEESALLLSLIVPLYRRYCQSSCAQLQKISGMQDLCRLCGAQLQDLPVEQFVAVFLDAQMRVMKIQQIAKGGLTEVAANVRQVAETAAQWNCYGVVLCHNHPGGDAMPSPEDIEVTWSISRMLQSLRILLVDHLIISEGRAYSMAQNDCLNREMLPDEINEWYRPEAWLDDAQEERT